MVSCLRTLWPRIYIETSGFKVQCAIHYATLVSTLEYFFQRFIWANFFQGDVWGSSSTTVSSCISRFLLFNNIIGYCVHLVIKINFIIIINNNNYKLGSRVWHVRDIVISDLFIYCLFYLYIFIINIITRGWTNHWRMGVADGFG